MERLTELMESRIRRNVYVRFGGEHLKTYHSNMERRWVLSLHILQDSFVKILTSIDRFEYRGEGSLKAWIRTLVANLALDYLRKNNRLCFTDDIPQEMEDEPPSMDEIPTEELLKMIGMLPIGYRTVLNLYVFEDKSHKEIAQILGIKENSSASQYARAKKMLNKMMQNYMKGMQDETR